MDDQLSLLVMLLLSASAFATFSYQLQLEGVVATMSDYYDDDDVVYDTMGMGASLVVKLLNSYSGIGERARLGAACLPYAKTSGFLSDWEVSSEKLAHDFSADVGFLVEIPGEISPYAGILVSWDSVDFRTGGNRDWHRTSYRTLGIGWTLGLAGNLTPSVRVDVGWTENYVLSTYRVRSRRENGSTTEGSKYYLEDKKGTFDRLSLAITFSY